MVWSFNIVGYILCVRLGKIDGKREREVGTDIGNPRESVGLRYVSAQPATSMSCGIPRPR